MRFRKVSPRRVKDSKILMKKQDFPLRFARTKGGRIFDESAAV
jgi:hypothetical protein